MRIVGGRCTGPHGNAVAVVVPQCFGRADGILPFAIRGRCALVLVARIAFVGGTLAGGCPTRFVPTHEQLMGRSTLPFF